MNISVIVPLLNEAESLPELCAWIERVMNENHFSYEVVMVDDGSTDDSWKIIEELHEKNPAIKGIRFRRNYGKSAALNVGFEACQGDFIMLHKSLKLSLLFFILFSFCSSDWNISTTCL